MGLGAEFDLALITEQRTTASIRKSKLPFAKTASEQQPPVNTFQVPRVVHRFECTFE